MQELKHKQSILNETLSLIPWEGCNDKSMRTACKNLGLDEEYGFIIFPNGIIDLISDFNQMIDIKMNEKLSTLPLNSMKIRDKIFEAIKIRLAEYNAYKLAVKKILAFYAFPGNNFEGLKSLYKTTDNIWYSIGDNSTDFNFYTKRASLAVLYLNSVIYWSSDDSINNENSLRFVQKQIDLLLKFNPKKILSTAFNNIPFLRLINR
ncbi:MAG: COQ9 family protein [Alphaproteobacteria bacterium]